VNNEPKRLAHAIQSSTSLPDNQNLEQVFEGEMKTLQLMVPYFRHSMQIVMNIISKKWFPGFHND